MKAGVTKREQRMNELVEPPSHFRPAVGEGLMTRWDLMDRLQDYMGRKNCRCPKHPTMMNADPVLKSIFGKKRFRIFDTLRIAESLPAHSAQSEK